MTEKSAIWTGAVTGDASLAPYTHNFWSDMWDDLFNDNRSVSGVIRFKLGEFPVTYTALKYSPIMVGAGKALVDGTLYTNTAPVSFAIPTPAADPRIDRIVLRKDFTTQTVRLTRIAGAEATPPVAPAITQTDGTTWDMPLYQVYINTWADMLISPEYNYLTAPIASDEWVAEGRLTPLYGTDCRLDMQPESTVSGYDVISKTITTIIKTVFTTGQAVVFNINFGGIVAGTVYYVRTADSITFSVHTNFYDAYFDRNRVTIAGVLGAPPYMETPFVYYMPFRGNTVDAINTTYKNTRIRIPDGGPLAISLDMQALGTTNPVDIFIVSNRTLASQAWASATARATNISRVNGTWVNSGDTTQRYLGTVKCQGMGGGATIYYLSNSLQFKLVWNMYNKLMIPMYVQSIAVSWNNATTAAWEVAFDPLYILVGLPEEINEVSVDLGTLTTGGGTGLAIDEDITVLTPDSNTIPSVNDFAFRYPIGLVHYSTLLIGARTVAGLYYNSDTQTFYGTSADPVVYKYGIHGHLMA